MKCKVCGRELNPNKSYCEKCGSPVLETKLDGGEFSWNTIDFPKSKKMEDIEMKWPGMNTSKQKDSFMAEDASEGFVHKAGKEQKVDEPKAENTQAAQFVAPQMTWTMPSAQWVVQQPVQTVQPVYVAPTMPTMPTVQPVYIQPIPAMTTTMQMPQLNLNPMQNTMQMPAVQQAPVQAAPVQQATQPMPSAAAAVKNPIDVDNWLDEQLKDSKQEGEKFFTFYKKNEEFQKLLDEEYENYKKKFDTNATSLNIPAAVVAGAAGIASTASAVSAAESKFNTIPLEPIKEAIEKAAPAEEKTAIYNAKGEHAFAGQNLSEPSTNLFAGDPVTDFDKMIFDGTKDSENVNEATLVISNEELRKEIEEVAEKVEAVKNHIEYDSKKRQQDLDDMAAARAAFLKKDEKEDLDKTSAIEIKSIFDEWDKQRKEAEENQKKNKKKKGGFGRFLLILLILIALFIGADFAVMTFVSDSPIRDFFYNVNIEADKFGNSIIDKLNSLNINLDFLKKKEKEENSEPVAELTDQEKIIEACNTNIKSVTCNVDGSKYSKDGKYGYNNIGSCTIVTDEDIINAATETLVKYNCAWIDYVNSGSDISCFDYLKADGEAFKLASSFEGVGKIKEEFLSLNIGEIRQNSKEIFVFADENILVKNGNGTTEVPSRLIYRMVKIGDIYKIVEYDNYGSN